MRLRRSWRYGQRTTLLTVSAFLLATVEADTTTTDDTSTTAAATTTSDTTTSSTTSSTDTTSSSTTASSTDSTASSTSSTTDSDTSSTTSSYPTISSSSTSTTSTTSSSSSYYTIPTVTVPPTTGAPYMQKSNLPEGTVFICIGAALALVGLVMIIWQLAVRWWINRSVHKAALASLHYPNDTKSAPSGHHSRTKSGIYSQSMAHDDSNHSLEKLVKEGRHNSAIGMGTPNSSLFFSPTAGVGMHSLGGGRDRSNSGNHMPPTSFYSSPNHSTSGQVNGMSMTQIGYHSPLSGRGTYQRPRSGENHSPLVSSGVYDSNYGSENASPDLPPISTPTKMPGTRAPSQFLDDLMSIPSLPPPQQPQQISPERKGRHRRRRSSPRK